MPMGSQGRLRGVACSVAIAAAFSFSAAAQTAALDSHVASVNHPSAGAAVSPAERQALVTNYGKLPISFEANQGQTDKQVKFLARGSGYGLYLTGQEAVLTLHAGGAAHDAMKPLDKMHALPAGKTDVVRMQLRGANPEAQAEGVDMLPGKVNYFTGKDQSQWKTGIPTYSKVKFAGVYPGVDLVYYGNQSQLEYDFVVAPQADAKAIRLHFDGARKLALTADGDLAVSAKDGQIAFHKPVVYQDVNGQRRSVEGKFSLMAHNSVGFTLGEYDHAHALVIDPVLAYSTFLGWSQAQVNAIAVDANGNAYLTGETPPNAPNPDFDFTPFSMTAGAYQGNDVCGVHGYGGCAFVAKLNAAGTAFLYATYLTGGGGDSGTGIVIDSGGNAYITGQTQNSDFPVTTGAFQTVYPSTGWVGWIAKLNSTGSGLIYSTFLPGSRPTGIAIDGAGDAYVAGSTNGYLAVTDGALQTTFPSKIRFGNSGFVSKLNPDGSILLYSTYLGGSNNDSANSIAIDPEGNAYVAGSTESIDFPITSGAFQNKNHAASNSGANAFVAKVNSTGSGLIYSTYIGGSGVPNFPPDSGVNGDFATAITIDGARNAYITGSTDSYDFPVTAGAFQSQANEMSTPASITNASFVTKLDPSGTSLVYSTYLGGNSNAMATSIVVDGQGDAYVTGSAQPGFPTTGGAYQMFSSVEPFYLFGATFWPDSAFAVKLSPDGNGLLYSTYLGGNGGTEDAGDHGLAIATDSVGNVYVAGLANSTDFPLAPGAIQTEGPNSEFGSAAFVSKLAIGTNGRLSSPIQFNPPPGKYAGSVQVGISSSIAGSTIHYTDDGSTPTASSPEYTDPITLTNYTTIKAIAVGPGKTTSAVAAASYSLIPKSAEPVISPTSGSYSAGQLITISDDDPNATIRYTTDGSVPTLRSPLYHGTIKLTGSETIRAIAVSTGHITSDAASATYTTP